ncbi:MAG: ABC transporter permease subunit, partial [Termitinemataceae bacterium]
MNENRPLTFVKGRQTQAAKMRESMLRFLHYFYLTLTCAVVVIPILWMIIASLTKGKLLSGVPLLPDFSKFSLEHYQYLFTYKSQSGAQYSDFVAAFLRSLQIAIANTFAVVLLTTITGFVFSRFKFRGKKPILVSFLLLQMFPSFMGMIALFMIYRTFGWLNKPILLTFIYAAGAIPYNTYLIRGYMRSIPLSIDEAALIDGASRTQIFTKIVLPLSTPIIG